MFPGLVREQEKRKRKRVRDYKGRLYDVKEIPYDPAIISVLPVHSKVWLPPEEYVYVEGRMWTVHS